MKNIINLNEIKLAKQIVNDIPLIKQELDKTKYSLIKYIEYKEIDNLLSNIDESIIMLDIHYEWYVQLLKSKGVHSE